MEFYQQIRHKLAHRTEGFDFIFSYLNNIKNPIIVETGSCRGENNMTGDGSSSVLFDQYINEYGGEFHTVDISEVSYNYCKNTFVCERSHANLDDSVYYLNNLNNKFEQENKKIDFLYLDSYDASYEDNDIVKNSARHHLYELLAIMPCLKKGSLIGVDDNWVESTVKTIPNNSKYIVKQEVSSIVGKGMYVEEYMRIIKNAPCFINYQMFWIKT